MASNKNIFCVTNPGHMLDALWRVIESANVSLQDCLVFLPSRRAVRSAEKMFVDKNQSRAILLPKLVALGEGIDDGETEEDVFQNNIFSNLICHIKKKNSKKH